MESSQKKLPLLKIVSLLMLVCGVALIWLGSKFVLANVSDLSAAATDTAAIRQAAVQILLAGLPVILGVLELIAGVSGLKTRGSIPMGLIVLLFAAFGVYAAFTFPGTAPWTYFIPGLPLPILYMVFAASARR